MINYRSLILAFLLIPLLLHAQKLKVDAFHLAQNEIISSQDRRLDLNNKPCAVLKIRMVDELEKVEGSVKEITVRSSTEKWVYVIDGTYQLRIFPKNHLPIDFDTNQFGYNGMEGGRVYVLTLTEENETKRTQTDDRAYLKLRLSPKTALVTIDGRTSDVDAEDGTLNEVLRFGRHIIECRAQGYVTRIDTINFQEEQTLHINMQRQSNPTVTIRSATPGATIYINDKKHGVDECTIKLSPRDYKVKVELKGYETKETNITVTDKNDQVFVIPMMKPLIGSLNVNYAPTDCKLIIDGQQHGYTPTIVRGLSVGSHSVVISKDGYKTYIGLVLVEANKEASLSGRLEKNPIQEPRQDTPIQQNVSMPPAQQAVSMTSATPQAVVLGLGVKWANMNVGAKSPEDYGDYFAWGETKPKNTYNWITYEFINKGMRRWTNVNKYQAKDGQNIGCWYDGSGKFVGDGKNTLEPDDDAARVNWGGKWRMPTYKELNKLITKCTWTWTTQNGVNGYKVTGPNGNSIFLPAAGYRKSTSLENAGTHGLYWSSSLYLSSSGCAHYISFGSSGSNWYNGDRYNGLSVRPVQDP